MKPLSVWKYLLGNRRRTIPVLAAVGLSVFLVCTMQALINVPMKTTWREYVAPYRHASGFAAKTSPIDSDFVEKLQRIDGVDVVYPCTFSYTNIDSVVGGTVGTQVLSFAGADMAGALQAFNLALAEGRLPYPGAREIALHTIVARNKGLNIGSTIGSDVKGGEALEGSYTVCGILQGDSILSVTSLEDELSRRDIVYSYSLGALVVPREGQLQAMNKALDGLDQTGTVKRTLQTVTKQYEQDTSSVLALMTAIGIMTIAIVSLCAGFLSYIHFLSRRGEFGILSAIGYTEAQVVTLAFAEISLVNLAGLTAGLLASAAAGLLLNIFLFFPRGLSLSALEANVLLKCFCVPLFTTIFSIIPVWRMLSTLDAATVLEGQA